MGYLLKQSSTSRPLLFMMVDSTDHISGKTGLSPTVTLSKNGGSFTSPSGTVTEIANGWYKVAGNATDSGTLGPLLLHATATGADPSDDRFEIVAFDPNGGDGGVMTQGVTQDIAIKSLTVSNSAGTAVTFSSTGSNGTGLVATGNGSGYGAYFGGGVTGVGFICIGGATSGDGVIMEANGSGRGLVLAAAGNNYGLQVAGAGSNSGVIVTGGPTGDALSLVGGSTSGRGITIATTSGDGISILPTAGNGILVTANGTSKHGIILTGGTAGTSDGLKLVAGTGGVGLRGQVASNFLDTILIDTKTFTAALQYIAASCAGPVSGGGTSTETFLGLDATTTRLTITVDANGNRSAITYG
jgi:hypothetical protein